MLSGLVVYLALRIMRKLLNLVARYVFRYKGKIGYKYVGFVLVVMCAGGDVFCSMHADQPPLVFCPLYFIMPPLIPTPQYHKHNSYTS